MKAIFLPSHFLSWGILNLVTLIYATFPKPVLFSSLQKWVVWLFYFVYYSHHFSSTSPCFLPSQFLFVQYPRTVFSCSYSLLSFYGSLWNMEISAISLTCGSFSSFSCFLSLFFFFFLICFLPCSHKSFSLWWYFCQSYHGCSSLTFCCLIFCTVLICCTQMSCFSSPVVICIWTVTL